MISVIIPTWNRGSELAQTINSVLLQTHKDIEILICDDGSIDNSRKLVEAIANHDKRLQWIGGKHSGGPAEPRNRGVNLAKGQWIAFLDSDDSWESNKLEKQIEYAIKHNLDLVCCNAYRVNGKSINKYFDIKNCIFSFKDMIADNKVICSSVLVKKSVIEKVGGFPKQKKYIAIEDYLTWLKVSINHKIGYLSEPLVHYNDQPELTIRSRWSSPLLQKRVVLSYILDWLRDNPSFSLRYLRASYEVLKYKRRIS